MLMYINNFIFKTNFYTKFLFYDEYFSLMEGKQYVIYCRFVNFPHMPLCWKSIKIMA